MNLRNLIPDLAGIVERYWGVHIEECATRIKREWSSATGLFYCIFAGRWYAVRPANETERAFLEAMWQAQ